MANAQTDKERTAVYDALRKELKQYYPKDEDDEETGESAEDGEYYDGEYYFEWVQKNFPTIYVYDIFMSLSNPVDSDETFHTVDVTIGDEVYTVDVGEVRVSSQSAQDEDAKLSIYSFSPSWSVPGYTDGLAGCPDTGSWQASEELTVTGLHLFEDTVTIRTIHVVISSASGMLMDFVWDGKTPFTMEEGDVVAFGYLIQCDGKDEERWYRCVYPIVEYMTGNGVCHEAYTGVQIGHSLLPYELYAVNVDGLDLEPYYRYLYPLQDASPVEEQIYLTGEITEWELLPDLLN